MLSLLSYLATGSAGERLRRGAYNYGAFCKFQLALLNSFKYLCKYINNPSIFFPFSAQYRRHGRKKEKEKNTSKNINDNC